MNKATTRYRIEPDFSILAGPYNPIFRKDTEYMNRVIEDMKRGDIEYRITSHNNCYYVERKGMIVYNDE
jgi:hypothetical protein